MQNWKLTLTYDGAPYRGWQIQPGLATIQGELQSALQRILGSQGEIAPLPQGSGRTDTGVHALGQVASFALAAPIPAENLHRALNRTLPASIRVLETLPVGPNFHARHSAIAKTYVYRIFRGPICSPFLAPYVHQNRWELNEAALHQAAKDVIGEHDFKSLAASDPDQTSEDTQEPKSTIRTIYSSGWTVSPELNPEMDPELESDLLIYRVRGNGFLHHMVRNLVGTMLEIARGQFPAGSMPQILAIRTRSAAGPTAPAKGLFLHSVEYPQDSLL